VVDPALDDEDPVGLEQLPRRRVDGVEDHGFERPREIVEPQEDHRLALLRRQLLERADDPADGDDLAVPPPLDVGHPAVGLPPELVAHRVERMLGDVEAQALLLEREQLPLLELVR
jgi:hypothetical protein